MTDELPGTLLWAISEIRRRTGVGMGPMLSELPDAVSAAIEAARADGMEKAAKIATKTATAARVNGLPPPDADEWGDRISAAIRDIKPERQP